MKTEALEPFVFVAEYTDEELRELDRPVTLGRDEFLLAPISAGS